MLRIRHLLSLAPPPGGGEPSYPCAFRAVSSPDACEEALPARATGCQVVLSGTLYAVPQTLGRCELGARGLDLRSSARPIPAT